MSDRIAKLQKVAATHSDPMLRSRAESALAKLGVTKSKYDPIIHGASENKIAKLTSEFEGPSTWDSVKNAAGSVVETVDDAGRYLHKKGSQMYNATDRIAGKLTGEDIPEESDQEIDRRYNDLSRNPVRATANMLNRGYDAASMGAYNTVMDQAADATGLGGKLHIPKEERTRFAQEHPLLANAATAIGGAGGAPARVGANVTTRVLNGLNTARTGVKGGLMRAGAGAAAGAASGAVISGGQAAIEGEEIEDIGSKALSGAIVGGAFGGGGVAAGQARDAIRGTKKIGNLRAAEDAGVYKDKTLKATNDDRLDVIADRSRRDIDKSLSSRISEERGAFGAAKQRAAQDQPDRSAMDVLNPMAELEKQARGSQGQIIDDEMGAVLDTVYKKFSPSQDGRISTEDLMRIKTYAGKKGAGQDDAARAWRDLNEKLGEVLPENMQVANKRIAGELSEMERVNQLLESSDNATPSDVAGKELARTKSIRGIGGDSQAERLKQMQLQEHRDLDPALATAIDRQLAARTYKDTRGTFLPSGATINAGAKYLQQNAHAIGRGADRVAGAAQGFARTSAPQINTISEALAERRRRRQAQSKDQK